MTLLPKNPMKPKTGWKKPRFEVFTCPASTRIKPVFPDINIKPIEVSAEELTDGKIDWIIRQLMDRYRGEVTGELFPLREEDVRRFLRHVAQDKPLPDIARAWLRFCFARAAEGESLNRMLGLVRKHGRPKKTDRHFEIAVAVAEKMQGGETLEKAAYEVSEQYRLSESKVQAAYIKFKEFAYLALSLNR